MKGRALALVVSIAAVISAAQSGPARSFEDLRRSFVAPPPDSRIMMRWWWFGPSVTHAELERELRAMRDAGIGGVEIQPVYPLALDDPDRGVRNLPYLSDEFLDALRFAAGTARELGLRVDLTLGSGWPFGGPQVGVADAAGRLRIERTPVTAGTREVLLPHIGAGEAFIAAFLGRVDLGDASDGIVRLPDHHGPGEVVFFIASRTGMMVKRAAAGAEGFVLNHYDRGALDRYLESVGERLLQAFGPNPPFAIFCDSLEVYDSDWTPDFLDQFRARRGYDLRPHLPALVAGSTREELSIRHDWGQTLTELLHERFVDPLHAWAQRHRTQLRMQAYGIPPATLSTSALVDLPEGEGVQWKSLSATRWAASASHAYGRTITSSETWTWLHSPSFRATPLDIKAEADVHFLQGVNQLIGHGWPYSPQAAGRPGWRFYAAGAFNDGNPWWIVMPDVSRYLQRVSFLMRHGAPVDEVAIYLPTSDAWAGFTPGRVNGIESLRDRLGSTIAATVLDAGFNVRFVDDAALRAPGGAYGAVVLPALERVPPSTLQALSDADARGVVVIATGRLPDLSPAYTATDADHAQIRAMRDRLFRSSAGRAALVDNDAGALSAALVRALTPDIALTPPSPDFGFVHRHSEAADIYFVANTGSRPLHASARIRVRGAGAEWWNPIDGSTAAADLQVGDRTTATAIDLQPYESRVLVFSRTLPIVAIGARAAPRSLSTLDISTGWNVRFGGSSTQARFESLRDWTADETTRFFSGVAAYEKEVAVPPDMTSGGRSLRLELGEGRPIPMERLTSGMRAWLDPPVREASVVFVNGRRAGSTWTPPYAVDVTGLIRAGANTLRIDVANTAINAMAGRPLPDYRLLNLRYGVRFEPQDMDKVRPAPSGLTGPIRLVAR